MSINFEDPMNKEAHEYIEKMFSENPLMDEKTVLFEDKIIQQLQMKELANIAKQPVTVEIHDVGEIKEMSDGTKYRVTPNGWVKVNELKPCPFCGGKAELVDFGGWEIICKCGALYAVPPVCASEVAASKEQTIAEWNTRVELEAQ